MRVEEACLTDSRQRGGRGREVEGGGIGKWKERFLKEGRR
jgi:hypothetical protein